MAKLEFDPNRPSLRQPDPMWATYIPDRRPQFKVHTNRGHALNAAHCRRDYILYQHNGTAWVEVYRFEDRQSIFNGKWKRDSKGKIAEPLEYVG